jgi:ribosomal protein S18 acetylase RimI-like enzyme
VQPFAVFTLGAKDGLIQNVYCITSYCLGTAALDMNVVAYQPDDFDAIARFVEAIQEHERQAVPELRPGPEIGEYAQSLVDMVESRDGAIFLAKNDGDTVGFICAWIEEDDDQLLKDEFRRHAYISDMYVSRKWRRKGVARSLVSAIETIMRERGCRQIRVCAKATNSEAMTFYGSIGCRPYEVVFSKRLD